MVAADSSGPGGGAGGEPEAAAGVPPLEPAPPPLYSVLSPLIHCLHHLHAGAYIHLFLLATFTD